MSGKRLCTRGGDLVSQELDAVHGKDALVGVDEDAMSSEVVIQQS